MKALKRNVGVCGFIACGHGKEEKMDAVLEQIRKIGIVPVVKIDRAEDALPLAKALCAGGLPCAEVTFRTDAAAEAIKIMTENILFSIFFRNNISFCSFIYNYICKCIIICPEFTY